MKNTTFFKQQSSNILFHSVYVLIYAGAIVLHSVAYPIPFLMLLLQFTMLASEEVNVRLFLIYPMVDSAHGEASGFFGVFCVCENILGDFHQSPRMKCCELTRQVLMEN